MSQSETLTRIFPAHESVADQQAEDATMISLTAMWRAAGRPEGRDPEAWRGRLAGRLVEGFDAYILNLERAHGERPGGAVWARCDYDDGPFRPGDAMAIPFIADVYAAYLDGRANRDRGIF